jgi:hypothetical protein
MVEGLNLECNAVLKEGEKIKRVFKQEWQLCSSVHSWAIFIPVSCSELVAHLEAPTAEANLGFLMKQQAAERAGESQMESLEDVVKIILFYNKDLLGAVSLLLLDRK